MRALSAPRRLYLVNRLLDSLRLPVGAEHATPGAGDPYDPLPTVSHFFLEIGLDHIITIRADWEKAGVEEYLRGYELAVSLLGLAEEKGQPLELGWRVSPLVKGNSHAKVSYVVGLDDGETFVPITSLPAMFLNAFPEEINNTRIDAARRAEQVFRTTFGRHLHIATRQLLDSALESLSPMKKKTIRLLEAYTSPTNYSWFRGANRGGDRRSQYDWTDEALREFAQKTRSLLALWQFVVRDFKANHYDPGYLKHVADFENFKRRLPANASPVPVELIKSVEKTQRNSGPQYQPLAFAMHHARHALQIPPRKYETLKKYYYKGLRLLKEQDSRDK